MPFLIEVRRLTKDPDVVVIVTKRDGTPVDFTITTAAFRFNAIVRFTEFDPFQQVSVIPVVESEAEKTVSIPFTLKETGIRPGDFAAELIWREDGTDPGTRSENADDFNEYIYRVIEESQT